MPLGKQVGLLVECKRSKHHGHHPLFEDCAYCGPEEDDTRPMARADVPVAEPAMLTRWCVLCHGYFQSTNPFSTRCPNCP